MKPSINSLLFIGCLLLGTLMTKAQGSNDNSPEVLKEKVYRAKNETEKFWALKNLVRYYVRNSAAPDSAIPLMKEMVSLAEKPGRDSMLINAYNMLAIYFTEKSDFIFGLQYYLKALPIAEKNGYLVEIVRLNNNIGGVYQQVENTGMALQSYYKVVSYLAIPAIANSTLPAYVYANMARIFVDTHKPDSALKYTQLANERNLKITDTYIQGANLINFAKLYEQLGNNVLAEAYYRQSIIFSDTTGNHFVMADAAGSFSTFLLKQKKTPEALHFGLVSLEQSQRQSVKDGIIGAADVLRQCYIAIQKTDSALYYSLLKDKYRDSVFSQQNISKMQDMVFAEQLRQKEQESEVQQAAITRNHHLQYAAIAIGLISFFIFFLVFSRTVASPRMVEVFGVIGLLIMFEFINLVLHPFTSEITHDSPFYMLLIMVCIAGVLVPLHHLMEKWVIHKLKAKNKKLHDERMEKLLVAYQAEKLKNQE